MAARVRKIDHIYRDNDNNDYNNRPYKRRKISNIEKLLGNNLSPELIRLINNYKIYDNNDVDGQFSNVFYLISNSKNKKIVYKKFNNNIGDHIIENELSIYKNIKHSNIMKPYYFDRYGILMQYGLCMMDIKYDSLLDIYMSIGQISLAIEHLHLNGFIYFDLKPTNVIVTNYNNHKRKYKLIDFGSCVHINDLYINGNFNKKVDIISSPLYASREVILHLETITKKHDMWSIGIMLCELVYDCHPYLPATWKVMHDNCTTSQIFESMKKAYREGIKPLSNNIHLNNTKYLNLKHKLDNHTPSDIISNLVCHNPQDRISSTQLIDGMINLIKNR